MPTRIGIMAAAPYHTNYLYLIPPFYEIMSKNSSRVEENMRLMKTLDDAWNSQDWDTFSNVILTT
jgi:hypothetical protein